MRLLPSRVYPATRFHVVSKKSKHRKSRTQPGLRPTGQYPVVTPPHVSFPTVFYRSPRGNFLHQIRTTKTPTRNVPPGLKTPMKDGAVYTAKAPSSSAPKRAATLLYCGSPGEYTPGSFKARFPRLEYHRHWDLPL